MLRAAAVEAGLANIGIPLNKAGGAGSRELGARGLTPGKTLARTYSSTDSTERSG